MQLDEFLQSGHIDVTTSVKWQKCHQLNINHLTALSQTLRHLPPQMYNQYYPDFSQHKFILNPSMKPHSWYSFRPSLSTPHCDCEVCSCGAVLCSLSLPPHVHRWRTTSTVAGQSGCFQCRVLMSMWHMCFSTCMYTCLQIMYWRDTWFSRDASAQL